MCTKANSGMPFFERNFTFCQSSFHFLFGRVEGRLKTTQWCSYLLSSQSAGSRGAVLDGAAGLRSAVGSCWWAQRAPEGPRAPSGGGAVNAGAAAAQFPPETPPGPQSRQQQPALAFQRRQPPGRGRPPQVFLGARAAHAQNSPLPQPQRRSAGAPCCVSARAVSTQRRGNSVGPSDGRRVNLGSHSVPTGSLSFWATWIWLAKVPEEKQLARGVAPGAAANLSPARWPLFLEDGTLEQPGFQG